MPKEPWEWDEHDLDRLIRDQVEESLELEYKGAGALDRTDDKKNEMAKDVSSFAHSAGDTLVYGIAESSGQPPQIPERLEGVDPSRFSKEWLEQVINSRIHDRIDGIRINPVRLTGGNAGKVAYVLSIPQSPKIHQASDHRYYKRFNFQSVPMAHYEIMDILNRAEHPNVVANVGSTARTPHEGFDAQEKVMVQLRISLLNVGHRVADRVSIQFWVPDGYNLRGATEGLAQRGGSPITKDGISQREFLYYHRQQQGIFPLFPGPEQDVLDGNYAYIMIFLSKDKENDSKDERLSWIVYADHAPPVEDSMPMYDLFFPPSG